MYIKPLLFYSLFIVMMLISTDQIDNQEQSSEVASRNINEIQLNLNNNEVVFSFLQLENGEATLVQNANGQSILFNTGNESSKAQLKSQLELFEIETINSLFITNHSSFHTGNLEWILTEYNVSALYVSQNFVGTLKEKFNIPSTVKVIPVNSGDNFRFFKNISIEILHSGGINGTLALTVIYGKTKMLYMGISDWQLEEQLLETKDIKSEILKVGFFGNENGTSQKFLDTVDPQMAIIFNKNGKMPSQDVMERLQEAWIDIFHPDKQGIIIVKCTLNNYEVVIVPTLANY